MDQAQTRRLGGVGARPDLPLPRPVNNYLHRGTQVKKPFRSAFLAGAAALAAVVATAGTADAHIVWTSGSRLIDQHTGACLTAGSGGRAYMAVCDSNGIINGSQLWALVSSAPDTGYANVEIRSYANVAPNMCAVALAHGTGPSQIANSSDVELATCNAGNPSQIWAMTTAQPRTGNTAHLNFFTFGQRVCLDGGIGVYGYPSESGCSTTNDYQIWQYNHGQYNDDGSPI